MSREAQKLDLAGGGGSGGVGIGVLSLDLLGQVLDRLREPRDRKACRLVSRAFERAEAAHRRALRVLRREPLPRLLRASPALERLDLSACASLDDASLACAGAAAVGGLAGLRRVCLVRASGVGWRGPGPAYPAERRRRVAGPVERRRSAAWTCSAAPPSCGRPSTYPGESSTGTTGRSVVVPGGAEHGAGTVGGPPPPVAEPSTAHGC